MSLRCHSVSIACIVLFIFVFSSCFIHSYLKILTCWMGWNCKMRLHLESSTNPFWVAVIYQPSTTHRDRPERNRSNSKGTKRLFRLMRWKVWPNNLDSNWSWRRHNRTSRKPPSQAKFFPGFDELSTDSWQTQRCKNVWKKQGTVGRIEWFIYIWKFEVITKEKWRPTAKTERVGFSMNCKIINMNSSGLTAIVNYHSWRLWVWIAGFGWRRGQHHPLLRCLPCGLSTWEREGAP